LAVLTLAVIPLVAEKLDNNTTSIYDVAPEFNLVWLWPPLIPIKLKVVCWPQHILFIAGIIFYVLGH
jgi:hypothetical protein